MLSPGDLGNLLGRHRRHSADGGQCGACGDVFDVQGVAIPYWETFWPTSTAQHQVPAMGSGRGSRGFANEAWDCG